MNKNKVLKYLTIFIFLGFIFIFPIINLITPDKIISEMENKILTQMPKISFDKIKNGSFMKSFDEYTSDQFPFRENFISLKNSFSYFLGIREFRNIYITNSNKLLEKFTFNKEIIDKNISQANILSKNLYDKYNINSTIMVIPTSIAFYSDDLPSYALSDNQKYALDYMSDKMHNFYTPYDILLKNKDKYIYFNTDHHWTQLGAKIAYDDLYNSIKNNDIHNYKKVSDDFFGSYYSKALLPMIKGDSIYAYENYNSFKIKIDFDKEYNTLYDNTKLNGKNKYQYFLHGDPAFAVVEGNIKSKKEILIFKDSFAHNFIPFLTNDYSKIHIIDPRYYTLDLDKYLKENNNISDALFINNIQTLNESLFYKNTLFD